MHTATKSQVHWRVCGGEERRGLHRLHGWRGENGPLILKLACDYFGNLALELDAAENERGEREISTKASQKCGAGRAEERELAITKETKRLAFGK